MTVEWEVSRASALAYHAGLFTIVMPEEAGTRTSGALCAVNRQTRRLGCKQTITRPSWASFVHFEREVWTQVQPIVDALAQTSDACLASTDGVCSSSRLKYELVLGWTEHRCSWRSPVPGRLATIAGTLPFSTPGTLVYPGGQKFDVQRRWYLELQGFAAASWRVRSPIPMCARCSLAGPRLRGCAHACPPCPQPGHPGDRPSPHCRYSAVVAASDLNDGACSTDPDTKIRSECERAVAACALTL